MFDLKTSYFRMEQDKIDEKRALRLKKMAVEFEKISALRKNDPVRFALMRIGAKWDALNAVFEKNGINDEFVFLRKDLKDFIRRSALTTEQVAEYCAKHPDRWFGERFEHGYNFNYKKQNN